MLESRARRFGLDLTQADYTIGFYTTAQGIPIVTSIAPNFLVRIA
jgi:predicted aspartyl protease